LLYALFSMKEEGGHLASSTVLVMPHTCLWYVNNFIIVRLVRKIHRPTELATGGGQNCGKKRPEGMK